MQLIYRGQTLNLIAKSVPSQNKPHAINWRFQVPNFTYSPAPVPVRSQHQSPTINWRFRVVTQSSTDFGF